MSVELKESPIKGIDTEFDKYYYNEIMFVEIKEARRRALTHTLCCS